MTPRDWYASRLELWTGRRDHAAAHGVVVSRLRLLTFFAPFVVLWLGFTLIPGASVVVAVLLLIVFGALVAHHARVLARVDAAEAGRRVALIGAARINRDWTALPEVAAPVGVDLDGHPYARDLDLFGHASLASWLGRPATPTGESRLYGWLLAADHPDGAAIRQQAVSDLASRAEWRETLAIEGLLGRAGASELARFIDWAEGAAPAIPWVVYRLALAITAAVWLLIVLQILGVIDREWWLIPLLPGIVLSFAMARRMYSVFDRASMGQRALDRYSAMLKQVCDESWTAPELIRLQNEMRDGGDAPRVVRGLSRMVEWSELRTAAALLHFPIQAFTLWDFHVMFAIERWRAAHGRHVRRWLDALGQIDALSILAAVRHDCPDWALARIEASATAFTASSLGHPLIPDARRVSNDVEVGPSGTLLLITGSNMSGKSTLLRAIGISAVLAQAGAPVCAASLRMPRCDVWSSIRIQDSLELGHSYFMAALARLKAIVDASDRHAGVLYLLDEVLQGTNSAERSIAVRGVAQHLLRTGAIGVMTSHDLSLAHEDPFVSVARLQHFAEQVHADGQMTFDYKLRPGLATSRNALRLMQLIGLAPE
jgi:hypothetical protein